MAQAIRTPGRKWYVLRSTYRKDRGKNAFRSFTFVVKALSGKQSGVSVGHIYFPVELEGQKVRLRIEFEGEGGKEDE